MGLTKHGVGEVLKEDHDLVKTAAPAWSKDDETALDEENKDADDA